MAGPRFGPVTIGSDIVLLERALKALGRPAQEVTTDDVDRLSGTSWWRAADDPY
ncbi:MAG: hypothetical protein ACRDRJ_08925 [Streptosporangiaceae bacterium]